MHGLALDHGRQKLGPKDTLLPWSLLTVRKPFTSMGWDGMVTTWQGTAGEQGTIPAPTATGLLWVAVGSGCGVSPEPLGKGHTVAKGHGSPQKRESPRIWPVLREDKG